MAGRIRYTWAHFLLVPILPVNSVVHSELESCAACNNATAKNARKGRKLDLDIATLSSSGTYWRLHLDGDLHGIHRLTAQRNVDRPEVGSGLNCRFYIPFRQMQCLEVL